jgi:TonB-linked SusC/RagA family outer membrane protein
MKLTAILLFVACLQVSARGFSQTVTLSLKNASLEEVFNQVKKQTGLSFIWDDKIIKQAHPVDIDVKNATVPEVLNQCLQGQALTYEIIGKIVAIKQKRQTDANTLVVTEPLPPIDVHGRIVNEKGEPVAGASVKIKGSDKGTSTNENGEFTLTGVDANATFVISGVNIESFEVKVNGRTDLATISTKTKVVTGEEVEIKANTGYQIVKPNEVTGSVVVITKEQLQQRVAANILDKLEGITNGVVFNKNAITGQNQIRIRGESTIFGYQDPLLVVDNFPYPLQNINEINPNDVESITILKDAAATSIYGARAGNGVIVITTKSGKIDQPLRVQVYANTTVTEKPDLFYAPIMSPSQLIDNEIFRFGMGEYDGILAFDDQKRPVSPVVEILNNRRLGLISSSDSASQIDALRKNDWRQEALKHLYRNAVSQQYQINLSGGSSKASYYFSTGYDKNLASLVGNESNRITLNNRVTYRPFKKLELNINMNYNEQESVLKGVSENSISNLYSYMKLADENGTPLAIPQHRVVWEDTIMNHGFVNTKYYPLAERDYTTFTGKIFTTRVLAQIQYSLLKVLKASVSYQYYRTGNRSKRLASEESYYIRNNFNRFAIVSSDGNYVGTNYPLGGQLNLSSSDQVENNGRFQLDYNQRWYNHAISAIAGYEILESRTEGNSSTFYGYDEANGSYAVPDLSTFYPVYVGETQVGTAQIASPAFAVNPYRLDRFRSYYTNATYLYKNRYGISASARLDQANIFGVKANQKGTPLWSMGARWDISKERLYSRKLAEWLPELSLKASYGYQGNISPTAVAATTIHYEGNDPYTGWPVAVIQHFPNPDLRWEKIAQMNIALNFTTKNSILSGDIEYFKKIGKDMLGESPLDPTTGVSQILGNFSDISSKGVDIILTTKNIDRQFKWSTTFIFNYAVEKVTRYDLPYDPISTKTSYFNPTPLVGYPLYSVFSYRWGGLDPTTGDPRIYLGDTLNKDYSFGTQGKIKMSDLVFNGRYNPPIAGSLSNTISWRSISFTFNLVYKLGHYFRRPSISYSDFLYDWRAGNPDYILRWQKSGDELITNVPSSIYPQQDGIRDQYYLQSDILVEKADHVRLQFIDLSYSFDQELLRKMKMQNLSLHFYANNLGIIWRANDKKIDPDYPYLGYPPPRSFSFGINATF